MNVITVLLIIAVLSPFFLQVICLLFLMRYNKVRCQAKAFSFEQSLFLLLTLVIIPFIMFSLSFLFFLEYKSQKGEHWFYYIHDGQAGLTLMPIYLIVSINLSMLLFDEKGLATSRANYIMVATLAGIAAWYTFATLALNFTKSGPDFPILAIVPAITCLNYLLFLSVISKKQRLEPLDPLFAFVWFSALITSIISKYSLAKNIYENLPEEKPLSCCFVFSAAAKGHPKLVKSWVHPNIGKPVNRQWYIFKHFETLLSVYFPKIHHVLRHIYNYVGPSVAKRIRYTWQADLVYILLKPIEWLIAIILKLANYQ